MIRYIPYVLGVGVLTGATWWQAKIVDRWGMSSISVEELNTHFERVPHEIGDWVGTDQKVEKQVTDVAGAVAHVNRVYKNEETGDEVHLWLIAGHAKDIVRHTPNICYPAAGYTQSLDEVTHTMSTEDGSRATFWTTRFSPEADASLGPRRVFWAWAIRPKNGDDPQWVAPSSPRRSFGNTTELYKMYFTAIAMSRDETAASSPCAEFARICIPQVNDALFGGADSSEPSASQAGVTPEGTTPDTAAGG